MKSHFTSSTSSLVRTWSPRVTTFSSQTLKPFLSRNVATLQFMLSWWTMDLEKFCVTQLYARIRTLLSSWSTSRMGKSYGKISPTFWRLAKKIKCSDIRFRDSLVTESTKRWVWLIQCKKHRSKSFNCSTNQNKIQILRLMRNLMTHPSWQPVNMSQRITSQTKLHLTQTMKSNTLLSFKWWNPWQLKTF